MPLYDYQCQEESCKYEFEQMETIKNRSNPEKKPCPKCGKKAVKQLMKLPRISSGGLYKKHDSGFKEVLAKVAQNHPKHELDHLL